MEQRLSSLSLGISPSTTRSVEDWELMVVRLFGFCLTFDCYQACLAFNSKHDNKTTPENHGRVGGVGGQVVVVSVVKAHFTFPPLALLSSPCSLLPVHSSHILPQLGCFPVK